ncbi:MAG: hypothetical protein P8080_11745 [Gammaproteobacteria bacterium]
MKTRILAAPFLALAMAASPAAAQTSDAVQAEIEALKQRISELEAMVSDGEPLQEPTEQPKEAVTEEAAEPETGIDFGGAVRLNYAWRDYDDGNKDRVGDFELELIRINMDGQIGGVGLSAEHRFYNGFEAIHHAYVEYPVREEGLRAQLGITQVPFGILPYASHSFWFSGNYYMGFEDDYDTGLKFLWNDGPWDAQFAFYKNPEYADDSRYGRYSFDLATGGDQYNSETNQWNARVARKIEHAGGSTTLGVSAQYGQIYNSATTDDGERWAAGIHANTYIGKWNFMLQYVAYEHDPENPAEVSDDTVQLAAFDFPFLMAAEGEVSVANIARSFDLDWGPITGMTCYNDFTYIEPKAADWQRESIQNVTGCSISAGGLYTYVDWIAGKNMWFAGGPGIGLNDSKWRSRLNVNFGYYF